MTTATIGGNNIPASNASVQEANWSGSIPVVLSLAPSSLSSPAPPRPMHRMASRHSYLHLALREEVARLAGYAPHKLPGTASVEEPPDDDDDGENDESSRTASAATTSAERESSAEVDSRPSEVRNDSSACPECWFEDEASGLPLRWHLFLGVLYDLMKGRAAIEKGASSSASSESPSTPLADGGDFLPWRIRLHFTSYPTDRLLPLDDGADRTNTNSDDEGGDHGDDHDRVARLVKRLFRNSLKQALFLQHASSKVAMAINKRSHERLWDAVLHSDYQAYRELNSELQSGTRGMPSTTTAGGTRGSSFATPADDERGKDAPRLIPVRIMLDGMPAMQRPIKHKKEIDSDDDAVRKRPTELLRELETCRAPPYTTLGDVLAECLPRHFAINPSSGRLTAVPSGLVARYCVQGVRLSADCAVVDLWRALSHPDRFLYVVVVTG